MKIIPASLHANEQIIITGLEIMGVGVMDIDNHECMTLGSIQTPAVRNTKFISLAVRYLMDGRTDKWQLYFSTDNSMDGREVLEYYRTWFQLEFL